LKFLNFYGKIWNNPKDLEVARREVEINIEAKQ